MKRLLFKITIIFVFIHGIILFFSASDVICGIREEISLNGEWDFILQDNDNFPLKNSKWERMNIPGYLTGYKDSFAWFRKRITIPFSMQEKKIFLNFSGVKWSSKIFLNDEKVGEYSGAYEPFEVEITNKCRFNSENEILVLVGNKFTVNDAKTKKTLVPTGWHGEINYHGIWGNVALTAYPKIYVDDVFVMPSFQKKELLIQISVKNMDDSPHQLTISNTASAEDEEGKLFPSVNISVEAKSTAIFKIKNPWENPVLWWPYSPHIYQLKTLLQDSSGKTIDEKSTNFGFREFWIEGKQFRFNGKRINLKGAIIYFTDIPDHLKEETAKKTFSLLKKANVNMVRLYGQPWPSFWYDIADETGMLVEEESAIQPVNMGIDDKRFWENSERHIRGMIKRDRNHPSIIIFCLSNELKSCLMKYPQVKEMELIKKMDYLWTVAKEVDPTRPMMHEDGFAFHSREIENIHYPKEYVYDLNMGGNNYQYPNVAYWFNPNRRDGLHSKPDRPYFIGETLWATSTTPDGDSVFLGEDAYINFANSKEMAKAIAWEIQLKAYRYTEVPAVTPMSILNNSSLRGFNGKGEFPLNELAKACKKAFEPIAAFITEYGKNYFGNENISQEITLYNDTLIDSKIRFEYDLSFDNKKLESKSKEMFVEAGYFKRFRILFHAPDVGERKELELNLRLYRGNDMVFSDSKKYSIFPKKILSIPKKLKIGLYDKEGKTEKLLMANGLEFTTIKNLSEIPENIDFLIIGSNSFKLYLHEKIKDVIENFVKKGKRLLILKQEFYPERLFKISLTDHSSTMAFVRSEGHAVLKNISTEDMRFWRENNFVSDKDLSKAFSGNIRTLVDSGGVGGLVYSPMEEVIMGKGRAILCQMLLTEKYNQEPVSNLVLQNIFDYLSAESMPSKTAGLITSDNSFEQKLKSLGCKYENISNNLGLTDISRFGSLIFDKPSDVLLKNKDKIKEYLDKGGNVLICGLRESDFINIKPFIPQELSLVPLKFLPLTINKKYKEDYFIWGISNQDLYWLKNKVNKSMEPAPLFREITGPVLANKAHTKDHNHFFFLIRPGALTKIPFGKGVLLIDQINWEKIEQNNQNWNKAARYITSLLTNMGIDFN